MSLCFVAFISNLVSLKHLNTYLLRLYVGEFRLFITVCDSLCVYVNTHQFMNNGLKIKFTKHCKKKNVIPNRINFYITNITSKVTLARRVLD